MDVFLLLVVGALSGYILGHFFSWHVLFLCGPVLAVVSAIILQNHGFAWPSGVAIIVGCLGLIEIGYLAGAYFRITTIHNPTSPRNTDPHLPR
jgi:hypothetical protein